MMNSVYIIQARELDLDRRFLWTMNSQPKRNQQSLEGAQVRVRWLSTPAQGVTGLLF